MQDWNDEDVLNLWHKSCKKLREEGETESLNETIDACWEEMLRRRILDEIITNS
jgi:hypothetical protein